MTTMQAVVKTARGEGNVTLRDLPQPRPDPGQILLAVRAAGICGTDLHIYHDEYPTQPPVILGHELAGEVVAIGEGVTRVSVGDRVTTETYFHLCGTCRFCRSGQPNLCPERRSIGSGVDGGFAPYVVVPERNVHRLSDSLSFQEAALTEPLACVVHGALELPKVTPGDVAVVAGPGAIGLLTLQVARAAGATVIVLGTAADRRRLTLAQELGATRVIDVSDEDPIPIVRELTAGWGADIVFECSGAGPAALSLLTHVRRGGQYAQIGLFGKPVAWDLDQVCMKELRVTGSNASVPSAWRTALRLLADGSVRTAPLISDVYPLAGWEDAFQRFEQRDGVKLLLDPWDGAGGPRKPPKTEMLRWLPSQPGNGSGKTELGQSLRETSRPTYREFAPPPPLGKHIVCFWRHGATSMPTTVRVIPDGCVDIVWVNDQAPHVAGPMTKPVLYSIDSGTEIVAVRLRPGVAHRLLGESAKALLNQDVPLRDLWPCHRAAPWEEVIAERSESAKLAAIAEAITSRLRTDEGSDNVVMHVATWMAGHPFASLDELSGLSGLSDRQIRRQFDEAIGYGPKKLQRILRLQRLLWLASHESPSPNLAHLSFATGYADQSHMTREVVALTGASPRHLLNGAIRSAVADLFKTSTT